MTAGDATVGQDKTTIESVSLPRAPASPDHGETEEKSVGLANGNATAASINVSAGTLKTSKTDNGSTSQKEKDAKKEGESHKEPKQKHQASE